MKMISAHTAACLFQVAVFFVLSTIIYDGGDLDTQCSSKGAKDIEEFNSTDHDRDEISAAVRASTAKANDDVSISLIVVASDQRSSSTFLSANVLQGIPCHVSMHEILQNKKSQSGDAWTTDGPDFGFTSDTKAVNVDPSVLGKFILQVGRRKCQELLSKNSTSADICQNHCWVNYKHFWGQVSPWEHTLLWSVMMGEIRKRGQVFSMLVLERDVNQRWRSHWVAKNTGDWNTVPDTEHQKKVAEANVPNVSQAFVAEHMGWYRMIRTFAGAMKEAANIPVMEISFDELTTKPVEEIRALIKSTIMSSNQNPP